MVLRDRSCTETESWKFLSFCVKSDDMSVVCAKALFPKRMVNQSISKKYWSTTHDVPMERKPGCSSRVITQSKVMLIKSKLQP